MDGLRDFWAVSSVVFGSVGDKTGAAALERGLFVFLGFAAAFFLIEELEVLLLEDEV